MASPTAALRVSLVVWGFGHAVTGARRWWLGPAVQLAAIAGFVALVLLRAPEAAVEPAFVAGCALLAAWAAVAVHAYRRAGRRRRSLDLPAGRVGGASLLWLAVPSILLSTLPWILGGQGADPGLVLEAYVADWSHGRAAAARERFARPPGTDAAVATAWQAQAAGLRNDLLEIVAEHGADSGIDPDRALETVRWTDLGAFDAGRGRLVAIEVVRHETVRGRILGFLPTSSQRLVPLARLGEVRLHLVPVTGGEVWRIERIELGGTVLGG